MKRADASRARSEALRQLQSLQGLVRRLVANRRELTPGKTTVLEVKCGRKNCKCTTGERHLAHFLYVSRGGPLRRLWIPQADRERVRTASESYRSFRSDRAELSKVFKSLLAAVDELEAALSVPYEKTS